MLVQYFLSSEKIYDLPNDSLIEAYVLLTIYFIYSITNSGFALWSSDTLKIEIKNIKDVANTMILFNHRDVRVDNCVKFLNFIKYYYSHRLNSLKQSFKQICVHRHRR